MVRKGRLELPRVAPLDSKSSASTNSATLAPTGAQGRHYRRRDSVRAPPQASVAMRAGVRRLPRGARDVSLVVAAGNPVLCTHGADEAVDPNPTATPGPDIGGRALASEARAHRPRTGLVEIDSSQRQVRTREAI